MGSIAAGFGTMLAAPPRALYTVALRNRKGSDSETSSIHSTETPERSPKRLIRRKFLGASEMRRSNSDQSDLSSRYRRSESIEYQHFKEEVGSKGLGRVVKATIDGLFHGFFKVNISSYRFYCGDGSRVS
jgi:hypothetical protein